MGSDADEVSSQIWNALCDATFSCTNVQPEVLLILGRFASAADCKAQGPLPMFEFDFRQTEAAIDAGRAGWDDAAADACFQRLTEVVCAMAAFWTKWNATT